MSKQARFAWACGDQSSVIHNMAIDISVLDLLVPVIPVYNLSQKGYSLRAIQSVRLRLCRARLCAEHSVAS